MKLVIIDDDGIVNEVDGNIETLLDDALSRGKEIFMRIRQTLRAIEHENLTEAIVSCLMKDFFLEPDGHTIFSPEYYTSKGMPFLFVKDFARVHYKGGLKHMSANLGKFPLSNLCDVYNLELLQGVVNILDITDPTPSMPFERDTRARQLHTAIMEHIDTLKSEGSTPKA